MKTMVPGMLRQWAFPIIILLAVILPFLLFGEALDASSKQLAAQVGRAGYAAILAALLAADILLPVPSSVVALASGAAFGVAAGTAINTVGLSAGSIVGFFIGDKIGAPVARYVSSGPGYERLAAFMRRWGWLSLALCRPVPVLAEASVLLASSAGLKLRHIILATVPSNLAIGFLYALAGAWARGNVPLWALFLGSVALPALAWLVIRVTRKKPLLSGKAG